MRAVAGASIDRPVILADVGHHIGPIGRDGPTQEGDDPSGKVRMNRIGAAGVQPRIGHPHDLAPATKT